MPDQPDAFDGPYVPNPYDDKAITRKVEQTGASTVVTDFKYGSNRMLAQDKIVGGRLVLRVFYDERSQQPIVIQTAKGPVM